jgi:RNA polymerase sigma-70 factor (ECF subfamily)
VHDSGTSRIAAFERHRSRLFGLAYRMLGTRADAEDVVQEAYVRWHQADTADIRSVEAWLVSTATRLAIDRLRRLKVEREAYAGPWLPEPFTGVPDQPDRAVELASDLSMAFLVLLERLSPEERAAFLLHDVFDCGYPDIARILQKSEAACRQTVSRARERVREDRQRFAVSHAEKQSLLDRFLTALEARDDQALLALFTPDASWIADGGGRVPAAAHAVVGADRITRLVLGLTRDAVGRKFQFATVNGEPGMRVYAEGTLIAIVSIAAVGTRIAEFYVVLNPDKLAAYAAS